MGSHIVRYIRRPATQKKIYIFAVLGSLAGLIISILYAGWHANLVFSNVQDATIYPYLFDGLHPHDIILPGAHPNVLKFPLFVLQTIIPYNFVSFTIVNLGLLLLTVLGWCLLLAHIFGKKYLPVVNLVMSTVLLSSPVLATNLIETTIRNIEYPIGLCFLLVAGRLLQPRSLTRLELTICSIVCILFSLSMAGDSFMLYGFAAPILLALGIDWLQTGRLSRRGMIVATIVAVTVVSGIVLRHAITLLGVQYFPGPSTKILSIDSLGPSIAHASAQLPEIFGANIFGQTVKASNSIYFLNFILLIIGFIGIISMVRWAFGRSPKRMDDKDHLYKRFVIGTIGLSFIATACSYILSGLVVVKLNNGVYSDAQNIRYITLLPFLLVAGIIFIISRYSTHLKPFIVTGTVILILCAIGSIPAIKQSRTAGDTFNMITQENIQSVINILKTNNIKQIAIGDSLGAPVRFWSSDSVHFAPLVGCTQYMHQNTRLSWRQASAKPIRTALVIDRISADRAGLGACSNEQLRATYGSPSKIVVPEHHLSDPQTMQIWIYDYDLRQRLDPRQ